MTDQPRVVGDVDQAGPEARPARPEARPESFHDELRRRNLAIFAWSAMVFNLAYVGWALFDYLLAPEYWLRFLVLRLVAAAINTIIAVVVVRRFPQRTFEGFWLWLIVFGGFIAPMLPVVGTAFAAYVMGFTIVLFGTGLLPYWHPRWAISNLVVNIALASGAYLIWRPAQAGRAVVASVFFVLTAAGLSLVFAIFKYTLAKRDYEGRVELARTSRDLASALGKLRELDRVKTQFFANISHELRTPLTLIMAPVEELIAQPELAAHRPLLGTVQRNADRLLRLIDDLLDLSKLDAGGLRLSLAEVDLRSLAGAVFENCRPTAQAREIRFELRAPPSDRRIWADAHRLEIVLTNLVGNALKYTPDGGAIEIAVTDEADGIRVGVRDDGPGIAAEEVPLVFQRFYQAGQRERRHQGGVGIGLALARELVELHGGQMGLASEVGKGSEFSFTIPLGRTHIRPEVIERRRVLRDVGKARRVDDGWHVDSPVAAVAGESAQLTPPPMAPLAGFGTTERPRILIAEDQDELRNFMRDLLGEEFEVIVAPDGTRAWELFERERPDVVVSDVMMPGMTGTELVRAIKAHPQLGATPVILLTAKTGSEATLEGYAHGADDFVAKPFHPRVLSARVRAQYRLRQLSLRLAQQEKLASVGTLSAGVLHEIRNPVNAILNGARVLVGGKAQPEVTRKLLGVIVDGAERIKLITDALDLHARPSEGGMTTTCDVVSGLDATLALLEHRLGGVEVHRHYDVVPPVVAPAGPVNQVFTNLVENAVKAGAKNLWLTIATVRERVEVRVKDDGSGIPPEIAARIFDPFFTTAEPGKGSGLGLYLSRRIVAEHGGSIRVERADRGAELVVDLPALVSRSPQAQA